MKAIPVTAIGADPPIPQDVSAAWLRGIVRGVQGRAPSTSISVPAKVVEVGAGAIASSSGTSTSDDYILDLRKNGVEHYSTNYRGRQNHSFLISSQKDRPMSTERITDIFEQISLALPRSALKILQDRCEDMSIHPHDLRHTCAVLRLHEFLEAGVSMEEAMQKLRCFFGWSRTSTEPLRYARMVFEDRLAGIWKTEFDERVEVLRHLGRT